MDFSVPCSEEQSAADRAGHQLRRACASSNWPTPARACCGSNATPPSRCRAAPWSTAISTTSSRCRKRCAGSGRRAAPAPGWWRWACRRRRSSPRRSSLPAGLSEDQLEVQVESEASQYIPFALDEVSLDFDVIGPPPNSPEDVEVHAGRVAQGKGRGPGRRRRSRRPQADGHGHRVLRRPRRAGPRDGAAAAGRPGPDRRAVPDRRPGHPYFRAARRRSRVRARAAVRRQPADPGHRARLRHVATKRRKTRSAPATCPKATSANCWSLSWKAPRWK